MALQFWLRLSGVAPVAARFTVSSSVADCVFSTGAYILKQTTLSDLQSTFTVAELPPDKIEELYKGLGGIENLKLTKDTEALLREQVSIVASTPAKSLPPFVYANVQVLWKGGTGDVRHEVISVPG